MSQALLLRLLPWTALCLTLPAAAQQAETTPIPSRSAVNINDFNCAGQFRAQNTNLAASSIRVSTERLPVVPAHKIPNGTSCYAGSVLNGLAHGPGRKISHRWSYEQANWHNGRPIEWVTRVSTVDNKVATSSDQEFWYERIRHGSRNDPGWEHGIYGHDSTRFGSAKGDVSVKVEKKRDTFELLQALDSTRGYRMMTLSPAGLSASHIQDQNVKLIDWTSTTGTNIVAEATSEGFIGEMRLPSGLLYRGEMARTGYSADGMGVLLRDGQLTQQGRWKNGQFQESLEVAPSLFERILQALDKVLAMKKELLGALDQLNTLAQGNHDAEALQAAEQLQQKITALDHSARMLQAPVAATQPVPSTQPSRPSGPTMPAAVASSTSQDRPAKSTGNTYALPAAPATNPAPAPSKSALCPQSPEQRNRLWDSLYSRAQVQHGIRFHTGTREMPFLGCRKHARGMRLQLEGSPNDSIMVAGLIGPEGNILNVIMNWPAEGNSTAASSKYVCKCPPNIAQADQSVGMMAINVLLDGRLGYQIILWTD